MIHELQSLKGKSKLNFHKNIGKDYDQMNYFRQSIIFQFAEDPFGEGAQSIAFKMQESLLLMKVLQTKPQDRNEIMKFFDFYFTIKELYLMMEQGIEFQAF